MILTKSLTHFLLVLVFKMQYGDAAQPKMTMTFFYIKSVINSELSKLNPSLLHRRFLFLYTKKMIFDDTLLVRKKYGETATRKHALDFIFSIAHDWSVKKIFGNTCRLLDKW